MSETVKPLEPAKESTEDLSPGTKAKVFDSIEGLLKMMPEEIEPSEIEGYSTVNLNNSFYTKDGAELSISGLILRDTREIDEVEKNPDYILWRTIYYNDNNNPVNDFKFSMGHSLDGWISGDDPEIFLKEIGKYDARVDELLADPTFKEVSTSGQPAIILPTFEVTSSGEIYEAGVEVAHEKKIGEIGIGAVFYYDSEEEAKKGELEDRLIRAAIEQARKEFNNTVTEEKAWKLLAAIDRIKIH